MLRKSVSLKIKQQYAFKDGGCTCAGDVAKAFGAGADFVMLGGMLAGHDESSGDLVKPSNAFERFKLEFF